MSDRRSADFLSVIDRLITADDEMVRRTRKVIERQTARVFDPNSPRIEVIRIDRKSERRHGAWWSPPSFFQPTGEELIFPAWVYAQEHNLPDPNEMPNIMKDGDEMADNWTWDYYSAFRSLDQLDLWLPVPEMRGAVYDVPETCVRVYSINKDRVLFGTHQVGFMLDHATEVRQLTREEFVR